MQDPEQPDVTIEAALFAALERTKLVRCSKRSEQCHNTFNATKA